MSRRVAVVQVKTFENVKHLWDIERPFFCLIQDFLYMKLIVFHCWTTCHKPFSTLCKMKRAMVQYKSKLVAFLTENLVIPFLSFFGASLLDYLLRYLKIIYGYIICKERQIFLIEKTFLPGWILRRVAVVRVKTFENVKQLWDIDKPFLCLNQDFLYMKLIVFHCWTTCHKPFSDICITKRAMAQYKSKLVAFLNENHVIPFLGNFRASLLDNLLRYLKIVYGSIICWERRIFSI